MTRPSSTADAELMILPRAVNAVWKNARSEILSRALGMTGPEAMGRLEGERLKPDKDGKKLPPDAPASPDGDERRNSPLAIVCASLAKDPAPDKDLPLWESLLRLILTADAVKFSCPWLESDEALAEFLNSSDEGARKRCRAAHELLYAAQSVNSFIKNSLPAFYRALNANLEGIAAPVNDLESYEELRGRLREAALEARKLRLAAGALKKNLAQGRAGEILRNSAGDIFQGDVLDFLKILRSRQEEIAENLKEAAAALFPPLFDGRAARLILESLTPPLSAADMALLLEEIHEIEARLLKPENSQLAGNILPALLGEKTFDIEAFDAASDSGLAKPLSHRLIRGLEKGKYKADVPPAPPGKSDPALSAPAWPSLSDDALPLAPKSAKPAPGPKEPAPAQDLSPAAPALEPADGFDIFENEFSAPPQPEELRENPRPETMTIEQACAISKLEREREEERAAFDVNPVQPGGDFSAAKFNDPPAEAPGVERPKGTTKKSAAEANGSASHKKSHYENKDLDKNELGPAKLKPAVASPGQGAHPQLDFAALAASSLPDLAGKSGGLYWLSGNSALGLDQSPRILEKLVERENISNPGAGLKLKKLNGKNEKELFQSLLDEYDSQEGGQIYFLQAWEAPDADKFMRAAAQWLEQTPTADKFVKIICILDPASLYNFIASGQAEKAGARHFQLKPWTRGDLEPRLNGNGLAGPGLEEIMRESGGWPKLAASLIEGRGGSLSASDFLGGAGPAPAELARFIANEMGGKLDKGGLEEASVMLEMFPKGILNGAEDMRNWIQTLRCLSILRPGDQYLELDPIARGAILANPPDA